MADPTEVEESDDRPARNWRKELEDKAKQAEAKAAELERKLAFSEAGLTGLSAKQVKALLAAHEGDVTAEAIKATADDLGFFVGEPAAKDDVTDPEQVQRDAEVSELAKFAGAPTPSGSAVMSADEVKAQIDSFTSPEALKDWVLANPDFFTTGAT